ncbi:MAG: hypothetical protein ACQKBV_01975 [Puniceicoccales bacterium]
MSYTINLEDDGFSIRVATAGDLEPAEFFEMIAQTNELSEKSKRRRVLVDHSLATVSSLTTEAIKDVACVCETLNDNLAGGRLAVVLARDLDYGLSRIWLAYVDDHLTFESRLFRERDAAVTWLEEGLISSRIKGVSEAVSHRIERE